MEVGDTSRGWAGGVCCVGARSGGRVCEWWGGVSRRGYPLLYGVTTEEENPTSARDSASRGFQR